MRDTRLTRIGITRRSGMTVGERWQLASMVGMLVIVAMLVMRLRDADMVRAIDRTFGPLFAAAPTEDEDKTIDENVPTDERKSDEENAVAPESVFPDWANDTDPDEVDLFRRNAAALADRVVENSPYEMLAYRQLVRWAASQRFAEMAARATALDYHTMAQQPDACRGRLVRLTIDSRRITRCPPADWNHDPELPLCEIWGPLPNTGTRLVTAIAVELPDGILTGDHSQRLEFVGYFYKTLAYESGLSDEGRARLAPALIGRVRPVRIEEPRISRTDYGWLGAMAAIFTLIGLAAAIVAWRRRHRIAMENAPVLTHRTQIWLPPNPLEKISNPEMLGSEESEKNDVE